MSSNRRRFTRAQRTKVAARCKWRCGICGRLVKRADRTLDHIIPLSEGGPDTVANLQLAHAACNHRRKSLPLDESRRLIREEQDLPRPRS